MGPATVETARRTDGGGATGSYKNANELALPALLGRFDHGCDHLLRETRSLELDQLCR
jgi:hypothetical protein